MATHTTDPHLRARRLLAGGVLIVIGVALQLGASLFLDGVLSAVFGIGPGMHNAPFAAAVYETVHGAAQASGFALLLVGLGLVLWNVRQASSEPTSSR